MNISELFEEIQNKFSFEELSGELTLEGNCILWSYSVENDSEQFVNDYSDEEEIEYSFEALSSDEILLETYNEELEKIETCLDELNELNDWSFSDYDIVDNTISFKIF